MVYCKELYKKKLITGYSLTISSMLILLCFMIYQINSKTSKSSETVFIEYIPEPTEQSDYPVYRVTNTKYLSGSIEALVSIESKGKSSFGPNYNSLTFQAYFIDSDVLRVIIRDSTNQSWFIDEFSYGPKYSNNNYEVVLDSYPFGFTVTEKREKLCVFNMTGQNFYFSQRYVEVQSGLNGGIKMGIAKSRESLVLGQKKFGIWTSEENPGSHPYFIELNNNTAAGYFLHNYNGQEIELEEKKVMYRTTGGVFDLFIILGNNGEEVTRNLHKTLGLPSLPLYSALGYNYSPSGAQSTEELVSTLEYFTKNFIPLDGIWLNNVLDTDKSFELRAGFKDLHMFTQQAHIRNVSVNIGIPSEVSENFKGFDAVSEALLLYRRQAENQIFRYFDWFHPRADFHWESIFDGLGSQFDGFYFRNNQVYTGEKAGNVTLPFVPSGVCLECGVIPLDVVHKNGFTELDLHCLWASMQIDASEKCLQEKNLRKPILSTSTRTGMKIGHVVESETNTWAAFRDSLYTALTYDFIGIRSGINPCGSQSSDNSNLDLCIKWHSLSSFLSFFYNEKQGSVSSTYLSEDKHSSIIKTIELRYSISLYFYYLHFESSLHGGSITRPVLFEYFEIELKSYPGQFLLGSSLLIVFPIDNTKELQYFLPSGKWYNFHSGSLENPRTVLSKKIDSIDAGLIFIRGGHIIPTQNSKGSLSLAEMRERPVQLIIALDGKYEADGSFFVDDGKSKDSLVNKKFTKVVITARYHEYLQIKIFSLVKGYTEAFHKIDSVQVFGIREPALIKISDEKINFTFKDGVLSFKVDLSTFLDTQINIIF